MPDDLIARLRVRAGQGSRSILDRPAVVGHSLRDDLLLAADEIERLEDLVGRWFDLPRQVLNLQADLAVARAALDGVEAEVRSYFVVDARLSAEFQQGWNDAVKRVANGLDAYVRAALRGDQEGAKDAD